MARAFLIVMDSVGCGGAPDAADFGDAGSNTLAHIAQACAAGRADLPALERAACDPDPLIAEHAAWAVSRIRERTAEAC